MLIEASTTLAIELFVSGFSGIATSRIEKLLSDTKTKTIIKNALKKSAVNYARGSRLVLAKPLLMKDGLLTNPKIIDELRMVVSFEREPNYQLIATHWKELYQRPSKHIVFEDEARMFVSLFKDALRDTDIFRPVLESQDIHQIAGTIGTIAGELSLIENNTFHLLRLFESELLPLYQQFLQAHESIQNEIFYDFSDYLTLKTDSFVGRKHVFDKINNFIENQNHRSGYFFLHGDPGSGKSAILAKFVLEHGHIHHFNIRAEINTTHAFLRNICAQLVAAFELDYSTLPINVADDGAVFFELLKNVSAKVNTKVAPCVIVIDALDEIASKDIDGSTNPLYLPQTLPDGVFIIISRRRDQQPFVRVEQSNIAEYTLKQDDVNDQADIDHFIRERAAREKIQHYILKQKEPDMDDFVQILSQKSQGNFIYTRLILDDIEAGAYDTYDFSQLPQGLENYYQDHWNRIKNAGHQDWVNAKLPVILALTVAKGPISIGQISDYADVEVAAPNKLMIRTVLSDFSQFLYVKELTYPVKNQQYHKVKLYRWYHASFFDFIEKKDEIEEGVSLARALSREFQVMQSQMKAFLDD